MKRLLIVIAITLCSGALLLVVARNDVKKFAKTLFTKTEVSAVPNRAAAMMASPTQDSSSDRITVSGSVHTQADETRKQYVGDAELMINGESRHVTVTIALAESVTQIVDGSQTANATATFDFGDGNTLSATG